MGLPMQPHMLLVLLAARCEVPNLLTNIMNALVQYCRPSGHQCRRACLLQAPE